MAYRSQLTAESLTRATRLLAVSASTKETTQLVSARDGFATLDSLAHIIADLTFDVRDEFPKLAAWKRWGPLYRRWESAPLLCGGLWRGRWGRASYPELAWGFTVEKRSLRLAVWMDVGKDDDVTNGKSIRVTELLGHGGGLDRDRAWQTVRRQLQSWKFSTRA